MVGDSAIMNTKIIPSRSVLGFRKRVFGAPISNPNFSFDTKRLNDNTIRLRVRAVMQVGGENIENASKMKSWKGSVGIDVVSEEELKEKGFLGLRKTKLVCTIGPACSSLDDLEELALGGMNVARLNMCHNSREWHQDVIRKIKKLNEEKGFCVSIMIDTEGSQIHVVDHGAPSSIKAEVIANCSQWIMSMS